MKLRTLKRSADDFVRERPVDINKVHRNYAPEVHPFERGREVVRALNAVKMDKIMARPFIASMDAHNDSVYALTRSPKLINIMCSGAGDGEVKVWDLSTCKERFSVRAHTGLCQGVCWRPDGSAVLSCGEDGSAKIWDVFASAGGEAVEPLQAFATEGALNCIDHHYTDPLFCTAGNVVCVWDETRSEPVHRFEWGADSAMTVKFCRSEVNVFATTGMDRSLVLYDLRAQTPVRKLIQTMKTNALCWNPMEPYMFVTGCEDHNCYSYDMRHLDRSVCVHKDHVSAVMCVDFAPTGREFVSGSYDRTIRIFGHQDGHSREVYHTRRMHRVFAVQFSGDAKFVCSGSDDTNVRVWKTEASKPLHTMVPREAERIRYADKLKERYLHVPIVKRIARHHHVPKSVKKAGEKKRIMLEAQRRREHNRAEHSQDKDHSRKPARRQQVVEVQT